MYQVVHGISPGSMLFHHFASVYFVAILMLKITIVFEYCSADIVFIPGCRLLSGYDAIDSHGPTAMCSEFNIISTPSLLPNYTTILQIYGAKKLPTDVPLVPHLQLLSVLELPDNSMYNVSKAMFEGLEKLKYISLKRNYIKILPPDVFVNNMNLESVDLSSNILLSLESVATAVAELKNFKRLYLSQNKLIRWIKDSDFIPLGNASLEALDVNGCSIVYIESNAFQPLKFLKSLNVSMNPFPEEGLHNLSQSLANNLTDLSVYKMLNMAFFSCRFLHWLETTHLESLDISRNRFICFPRGNFPLLKSLIIDKCDIDELLEEPFSGMPNLESLSLVKHMITSIDKEFKSNIRMKVLDLSNFVGNGLLSVFKIADFAFENLKELDDLKLNNMPIKSIIRRYTFHGLTKIRSVSLYSDSIRSIDCFAFESLSRLTYLGLAYNLISELSNCTFYGLTNLRIINLSYNEITFFNEAYPFEYTPNLEYLSLSGNKIVKLPASLFRNLHVEIISLNGNIIQSWYHEFLPESSNLTALDLDENAITHFTQKMFDDLLRVKFVLFSKNPLNCSHCSTAKLREWMKNKTSDNPSFNRTGKYVCHTPDTYRQVDILAANITSATLHCFPPVIDYATPLYIALSFVICVAVISAAIWHRWSWNIKYNIFLTQLRIKKYKDIVDSRTFAFDAYVSYCESNLEWIESHLVPALEDGNPKIRLCLPDRNFDAGCSVLDNIILAIDKSRSTIIILSNDYLRSSWCLYNIEMAQNILFDKTRSGLIIVFLEDIKKDKIVKDIKYFLRTRTCIWWTENPVGQKLFWERLRLAIRRATEKGISAHIT